MGEKKNIGRFTLQLSPEDPMQMMAIEAINRQKPRGKAAYLTNAILHYEHCPERDKPVDIPAIKQQKTTEAEITRILLNILNEYGIALKKPLKQEPHTEAVSPSTNAEDISISNVLDELGDDGMAAIANAISSFRT